MRHVPCPGLVLRLAMSCGALGLAGCADQPAGPEPEATRPADLPESATVRVISRIDLGTLGGANSTAFGINAAGQVAGGSQRTTGVGHAFLWTPNTPNGTTGTMIDLGTLSGNSADFSDARGINAAGQVVGFSGSHAFLWAPDVPNGTTGTMTDLGTLGGFSEASGVNDAGQVVGVSATATGDRHGFLWTPATPNGTSGSMTDLGTLGGNLADAHAINAAGQVVGASETATGDLHAFLWTPATPNGTTGTMTDLGTLRASRPVSFATGINQGGQVAGTSEQADRVPSSAFLWAPSTSNGITGRLSPLASQGPSNSAWGINTARHVVGDAVRDGIIRPLLWRDGIAIDVGTLDRSASGRGSAFAINDEGQMVGRSTIGPGTEPARATLWVVD